jgi:hypothetical protein
MVTVKYDGTNWQWGGGSSSGGSSPLTTKGDLFGFDTANNRIPVGPDTDVLTADSTQPLGVKWAANPAGFSNPMTTKADLIAGGTGGTPTRLPVGSNGQVLTADSTQTLGVKWAAAGSGGSPTFAFQPTIVPPATFASGTWTKYDSGSTGIFTDLTNAVQIKTSAGNAWKMLYVATPGSSGTAFTLTTAYFPNIGGTTSAYPQACIFIMNSSNKFIPFGSITSGGGAAGPMIWVGAWNSFTSQGTDRVGPFVWIMPTLVWARIKYDGTSIYFYISTNGADWTQIETESATGGFLGAAPAYIGFAASNYSSTYAATITLVHWSVTTP